MDKLRRSRVRSYEEVRICAQTCVHELAQEASRTVGLKNGAEELFVCAFACLYLSQLLPDGLALLKDRRLLVTHELWCKAIDHNQELNRIVPSQCLDDLNHPVFERNIKSCSTFLQELLRIRIFTSLSQKQSSIDCYPHTSKSIKVIIIHNIEFFALQDFQ